MKPFEKIKDKFSRTNPNKINIRGQGYIIHRKANGKTLRSMQRALDISK